MLYFMISDFIILTAKTYVVVWHFIDILNHLALTIKLQVDVTFILELGN